MPSRWKKAAGPKPVKELNKVVKHNLARPKSRAAVAVAMALRPSGATQQQIISMLGQPHRNKLRSLIDKGLATPIEMPLSEGHKVYRLRLK